MDYRVSNRSIKTGVLVIIGLILLIGSLTGSTVAQEKLDVSLDIPNEVTAGEEATLSASVSTPELPGDHKNELEVTFYSDGKEIGSQTVTVADGDNRGVQVTHTFDEAGEKNIEAEATITLANQDYSGSATSTLKVTEPKKQISFDGDLSLNIDEPNSPEVGEETTTSVESQVPSITGAQNGELTLRLLVDGEETASQTITVSGDESTDTDFTTVFDSSGERELTVEAILSVGGQQVSESVSTTVNVSEVPTQTTSVEGAAFAVPKSLEDEVADYREDAPEELEGQSFVLATQDELYIVFTQKEPTKGAASVQGPVLDSELSTENVTYGAIAATSVSFETTGTEAGVQEISDNSEQYQLDLVRVNAHYRRVATLTDPDEGENFTLASTSGILIADPRTATSLFNTIGSKAGSLSRETSAKEVDTALNDPRGPHLHTFSFEKKFWTDAQATVDAIVLDPDSTARQFIEEYDQANIAHAEDGEPILYVVEEDFQPREVDNVESIKSQSESLDGEVVETEVRLYQEKISVQETLEHNTGCNEDVLEIQTPQGPACINVVQDSLLHGGVAWNTIPESRDGALVVMGASARHLDSPEEFEEGRYRIQGEIVSSSRLDKSLPEGSILVIYELERVGDINYEEVKQEARSLIEGRTGELSTQLRQQVGADGIELVTSRTSKTIQSVTPNEPATVSFSQSGRGPVAIQNARINVSSDVQNLEMNVAEVASLPGDVTQPPGQSVKMLNISTNADQETIENASFQIRVSQSALPDGESLTVYRYGNEGWTALETKIVQQDESDVIIEAKTPGFSYFAVGTQESGQGDSGENQQETTGQNADSKDQENNGDQVDEQSDSNNGGDKGITSIIGPGLAVITILAVLTAVIGWKKGSKRLIGIILLLVGAIIAAYFLGFLGAPSAGLQDYGDWGNVTDEQTEVITTVWVQNPNPVGIQIGNSVDVSYELYLNDLNMANGRKEKVSISSGNNSVRISTYIQNENLPPWWVAYVKNNETIPLRANTSAHVAAGPLSSTFQLPPVERELLTDSTPVITALSEAASAAEGNYTKTVGVEAGPVEQSETVGYEVQRGWATWGNVSREKTTVLFHFQIHNPSRTTPIPAVPDGFGMSANMNNITMFKAQGEEFSPQNIDGDSVIPPGETQEVILEVEMNNTKIDDWFTSHVRKGERTQIQTQLQVVFAVQDTIYRVPQNVNGYTCFLQTDILIDDQNTITNCGQASSVTGGETAANLTDTTPTQPEDSLNTPTPIIDSTPTPPTIDTPTITPRPVQPTATPSDGDNPPTARIEASPKEGRATLEVTFDASESTDPDDDIDLYFWDFNKGDPKRGKVVTHKFLSEGNKTVTLTVVDDNGNEDYEEVTITVLPRA